MSYGGVDVTKLLGVMTTTQPESLILVPELLQLLVRAVSQGWPAPASLKFMAVGGAVVSALLLEEATALRLPVYQGYGLSECGSVVCLNTPGANRLGSAGKPLPHVRVRCDEHGQIHVRGSAMNGYLGAISESAPEEIATGDLGEIDDDGFLWIKGRLRNVFITSLGRNVSPEWIERELTHETYIRHALAIGEARPFPVALIAPARPDIDSGSIARAVARANTRLPDYARVRRWAVMPEPPTLNNGLLTANGRLRREHVLARFADIIDALYEVPAPAETA
jgi:long-subunit acyl-CoA synthetase (AMP-forming)